MSRCLLREDASIATTSLFEHYSMECKDKCQDPDCTLRVFSETVLGLFPEVERKKIRKGKVTSYVYAGLKLKPLPPLSSTTPRTDLSVIPSFLHEEFKVNSVTDDAVSCQYNTEFLSNVNRIIKKPAYVEIKVVPPSFPSLPFPSLPPSLPLSLSPFSPVPPSFLLSFSPSLPPSLPPSLLD